MYVLNGFGDFLCPNIAWHKTWQTRSHYRRNTFFDISGNLLPQQAQSLLRSAPLRAFFEINALLPFCSCSPRVLRIRRETPEGPSVNAGALFPVQAVEGGFLRSPARPVPRSPPGSADLIDTEHGKQYFHRRRGPCRRNPLALPAPPGSRRSAPAPDNVFS